MIKKREDLPTDRYSRNRLFKSQHKIKWKPKQVQRPGDGGRQELESEDKTCSSSNWNIRNN